MGIRGLFSPYGLGIYTLSIGAALLVFGLVPIPARAEIAGTALIIDGDTIKIHGQRIRLHGIDSPEARQFCEADGEQYRCGQRAALALADKIGRAPVSCEERDVDRYGRIVAVCYVAGEDLNAWLVKQGHALAYRRYSLDYVGHEGRARAAQRGMWAGKFLEPWEWRRR